MNTFARRLEKAEAAIAATGYRLLLEDGSYVMLERAADFHLLMMFIEIQGEAYETGEPLPVIDHPHLELFARSVPRQGEGTIAASVRQWSRDYLAERRAS